MRYSNRYTLIELLVVIAIFLTISVVVVGSCSSHTWSVQNAGAGSNKIQVETITLPYFRFDKSAAISSATVEWANNNPTRKLISVVKSDGFIRDAIIITSSGE